MLTVRPFVVDENLPAEMHRQWAPVWTRPAKGDEAGNWRRFAAQAQLEQEAVQQWQPPSLDEFRDALAQSRGSAGVRRVDRR